MDIIICMKPYSFSIIFCDSVPDKLMFSLHYNQNPVALYIDTIFADSLMFKATGDEV